MGVNFHFFWSCWSLFFHSIYPVYEAFVTTRSIFINDQNIKINYKLRMNKPLNAKKKTGKKTIRQNVGFDDEDIIADLLSQETNEETTEDTESVNSLPQEDFIEVSYELKEKIENICIKSAENLKLFINRMEWTKDRFEVIITENNDPEDPIGPSVEKISAMHRMVYEKMELDSEIEKLLVNTEVIVASPGVSDVLRSDRDFNSFQGFPVEVTTKEPFRKKNFIFWNFTKKG